MVLSGNSDGESRRVCLLADVTVQTGTLRLSELLPPDTGTQLRSATETVSLGRAPQAGSLRIFTARELREAVAKMTPATDVDIPEQVIVRRQGWTLEIEAVRSALAGSHLAHQFDFSQARITLPESFTTVALHPQLEVTALNRSAGNLGLRAQVRCRDRSECASFLAEIAFSDLASAGKVSPVLPAKAIMPGHSNVYSGPVLVHPGHLAMLVIDGDGFRIIQPMMPLKPARLGELVRVSDPLTHRSLVARVTGNGVLRPGASRKEEAR